MSAGVRQWFSGDTRGQSTPLGYLLVIAIILAGTIAIVALGTSAIDSTRGQSELQRAEHSMTLFDSRTAMVALGASNTQTISFGQDSGSFESNSEAGWIKIEHHDYTNTPGNNEVIYNQSLGQVVYTNGDTEIAYQGGGVWRKDGVGDALMVSPPEFHYRRATLTLPIIRVRNDGQNSGNSQVSVSQKSDSAVYPSPVASTTGGDSSIGPPYNDTSPSGSTLQYQNPIKNGTVFVWVKSKYYEGWASYFEQRTTGKVTRFPDKEQVRLELISFGGSPGQFQLPDTGNSVDADGMAEGHPLDSFDVTLDVEKNKPHFSFYATESGKEFEIHVYSDVGSDSPNSCSIPSEDVWIGAYYYDGDGSRQYEAFETASPIDPSSTSGVEWVCEGDDLKLNVDFLSSDVDLTYDELGQSGDINPGIDDPNCGESTGVTLGNKYAFNEHMEDCNGNGWGLDSSVTWDQHSVGMEPSTYSDGGSATETMDNVVNHYMQLTGPDTSLVSKTGPGSSDPISEPDSSGTLRYDENPSSEFIAYLHVTENDVEVDFG